MSEYSTEFISGEKFQQMAYFWGPGQSLPAGIEILYACGDHLGELMRKLQFAPGKYVLVTHNSDVNITQEMVDNLPGSVHFWFGQNMGGKSDRVCGLPIGLANSHWPHGNFYEIDDVNGELHRRIGDAYFNVKIDTNPRIRQAWANKIRELSATGMTILEEYPVSRKRMLRMMKCHNITFSPPGNGADCHRNWELWYANRIPVIDNSIALSWFNLPAIRINSLDDLNSEFLREQYFDIMNDARVYEWDQLKFSYWSNKIIQEYKKL